MNDPLQPVIAKEEGWVRANRKPLIVGAAAMLVLVVVVLGIVHLL